MAKELKGWISGIRISGDLTVNTYRDDTVNPPVNTLRATANGNATEISWYDGATPDVKGFMKNFAPPYYPDEAYVPGDIRTNGLNIYVCEADTTGEFNPDDWSNPINVQDLLKMISPKEIFVGDDTPTDSEILWIDTDEDYPTPEGFISYAEEQTLTPEQQQRARNNIGAGKAEVIIDGHTTPTEGELLWVDQTEDYDVAEGSVRYDVEQTLTTEQKIRARHNIGEEVHIGTAPNKEDLWVDPTEDYSTLEGAVSYSLAQALTTEQQKRARMNIGIDLQNILNDIAAIKTQLGM